MNYFERYKQIISRLQELGSNIAYLKQSEWIEFNNLNEERAKLDEALLNAVKSQVAEADEAVKVFKTRLADIKNSLEHISGPNGTPGDIMNLELIWKTALSLKEQISSLDGESMPASPIAGPGGDTEQINISPGEPSMDTQIPAQTQGRAENSAIPETAAAILAAGEEAAAAAETALSDNSKTANTKDHKTTGKQKMENTPAGASEKASPGDKKAAAGQNKIVISPAKGVPAKKGKQNKKGSGKHPPLTIIPTKNITCNTEEILLEEIKKNFASIKQGKG